MTQNGTATDPVDLSQLFTASGKSVADFKVSPEFQKKDPKLVRLIMVSEAMKDKDRQHWFYMYEIMNADQKQKLYEILHREQRRLNEIAEKYGQVRIDPAVANRQRVERKKSLANHKAKMQKKEASTKEHELQASDELLAELDKL